MKCTINNNEIEIKHKYVRMNTRPSSSPDNWSSNYI